ncbi:hypothetical protein [Vitiosangium sp. GDMCC 1.1324]|uniref:hypothetical protein n=1 Tax=Vitiosangium sp. (strain GDMCC 1.1324) TaxID=2138576 RepID=UPI000D370B9F|nr:hypothetical protein [Vitiosangium sp. GDMCC 1.1324]PTL76255.1 hypothetical protein DAT35_50325 [Vitiosangium sp. GDMCC 1.1324]
MRPLSMLLLLSATSAHAEVSLQSLLDRLGDAEEKKLAIPACRFVENSVTEQLDKEGNIKGRLTRSYEVIRAGTNVVSRKKLSEKEEGELLSQLKAEPQDQKQNEDPRGRVSPFHPKVRDEYQFEQSAGPREGLVTVKITPRKADKKRMRGTAVVDPRTAQLISMRLSPSELPSMLDSFQIDFAYADTPCERQPTQLEFAGTGGVFFYKVRFRTQVKISGHQVLESTDIGGSGP